MRADRRLDQRHRVVGSPGCGSGFIDLGGESQIFANA
jgi:hypothetical protein